MPGGKMIGMPGTRPDIRELPGGIDAAKNLFDYLRLGGTTREIKSGGTVAKLPSDAGHITFRPVSGSKDPAININIPGADFKIHFPDGE